MAFTPIEVDYERLTIMGVPFPDRELLDGVAYGIGTNMYEGFVPTKRDIEIIRDYCQNKITTEQVLRMVRTANHEQQPRV